MKHAIQISEGYAAVRVVEEATVEGFAAVAKGIAEAPGWVPGMNILADYQDLDLSHVTKEDIKMFAKMFAPHRKKLGNGLCAIVNAKALDFGLGRMWQAFMESSADLQVNVFYTTDEAKSWLFGE